MNRFRLNDLGPASAVLGRVRWAFGAVGASVRVWPLAASAACTSWDLSAVPLWGARQSNGFVLGLTFQQHGAQLSGSGYYYSDSRNRHPGVITSGSIEGSSFKFTMDWGNSKGIYTGFIKDDGTISGNTRDARNRASRATWYAAKSQKATCLAGN
jgi:hypothetical protein